MSRLLYWILGLFVCASLSSAQEVPAIDVTVLPSHLSIPAGKEIVVTAELKIPPQTHLTENFLEIRLDELTGFTPGFQQVSDGNFEKGEMVRRNIAYLQLPVLIESSIAPLEYSLKGSVSYQVCLEGETSMCFPPKDFPFELTLTVLSPGSNEQIHEAGAKLSEQFKRASIQTSASLDQRLQNALASGSFLAFFLVFIGGFLTSLTPCVYPMIPITIGYIGGRSAGAGKTRGLILSLFYVLGLAIVYSLLGIMAALTGSLFGSITQTPLVIITVSIIFLLMGLSMLGLFDIQLPSSIAGRIQGGGPRKGFIGATIMGMVSGLVAAPCAGPVIIVLLAFIATTGNVLLGFGLMMSFALGMGLLFIAIGTFSGLLTSLPQAGEWMDHIKKTFGVILLAASFWILHPLLPPPLFGLIVGMGLLILGAGLGAFIWPTADATLKLRIHHAIALLLSVSGIYVVVHLIPIPGRVIPQIGMNGSGELDSAVSIWRTDLLPSLEDAKTQQKLVILDFGAEWCVACKELEHKTFSQAQVIARLKNMIPVRIDCTDSRNPEVKKHQEDYMVKGLPTVIVLDPDGMEIARFVSFLPPEQFLTFLDQAEKSFQGEIKEL